MNKKGSASIFLVFILSAMIGLTAVFIYASKQQTFVGISDGVLNLGMRSVLSEFDLILYERYGIMAFEKSGMGAALEISDYVDYAFDNQVPVKKVQVEFGKYSMGNMENIKQQILEYMKSGGIAENFQDNNNDKERADWEDRTLRNQGIIHSLPSKPFADGGTGFIDRISEIKDQIKSVDDILSKGSDSYLLDSYIMSHFKCATGGPLKEKTFFQHEVEYILTGNFSNSVNIEKAESALKILRSAMNAAYLYSDEKRYAQTLTAAELLTPASAPATQAVIITTWAAAEAKNDVKLLMKGKAVPLMKSDASWATSLDNVLNNTSEGYIDPGNDKGLHYSDYMMVFLHFQNEDVKLARICDLIQINMKACQDRDFLMKTCNEGMYLSAEIYGREHSYETCY